MALNTIKDLTRGPDNQDPVWIDTMKNIDFKKVIIWTNLTSFLFKLFINAISELYPLLNISPKKLSLCHNSNFIIQLSLQLDGVNL